MRLHPEPFARIQKGMKNVECRLYDEKRRGLRVGDVIEFQLRPECIETFERKIVAIHTFETFAAMFEQFPEERANDVYQYYTIKEEQTYGVIAIKLGENN